MENLDSRYVALAASEADTKVDVLVRGVSTVIDEIDATDIKAYVDLTGYGVGTHNVPVKVTGSELKTFIFI